MTAKYYEGLAEARVQCEYGTLEENLNLIDTLYGREELQYGDSSERVKEVALSQLEREFTIVPLTF